MITTTFDTTEFLINLVFEGMLSVWYMFIMYFFWFILEFWRFNKLNDDSFGFVTYSFFLNIKLTDFFEELESSGEFALVFISKNNNTIK